MQIKLQQAQSAKALCENMNKVLQVSTDWWRVCCQAECRSDLCDRLCVAGGPG